MTPYKIHPVTAALHHRVALETAQFGASTILDIGGTGKLKEFVSCKVQDVNLTTGVDGCCLPFENSSFDVTVSIATLEHVACQEKFLAEALRVSRTASIHWFPYGSNAVLVEEFKKRFWDTTPCYRHACTIPPPAALDEFQVEMEPFITVSEHLLLLATLYESMNCKEVYTFAQNHAHEPYGVILRVKR